MSCKTPLKDDNNNGVGKDIEILNKISQRAINNFSVYARTKNTINSTEYQNKFDKLYTMVNKETESKKLNQMDEYVKNALATLKMVLLLFLIIFVMRFIMTIQIIILIVNQLN